MIGDRPEDAQAAVSAGITFVDAEAWRTGAVEIVSRRSY
jgi:phosphoglycolate phosphatase-like HAD superfamily hydrolase